MPRILIVDAYPREGRANLASAGGTEGGILYRRMLERIAPGIETDLVYPADDELPDASRLGDYAGAAWTGSNLSILDTDDPRVSRQVDLARDLLAAEVPNFGSCFAVQIAAVARGGRCAANPKGREFGTARKIRLSKQGSEHPLYRGKPEVFDAFTSHADHVVDLPAGATRLASNDWSPVQAACLDTGPGSFWAVQYHPEYDLHEVASLCRLRKRELVDQGSFATLEEAERYVEDLEALHADPSREDLATALDVGPSLLDEELRTLEVRNWLSARALD
jgi:GMP synthase (glutamine-hydrolysing)